MPAVRGWRRQRGSELLLGAPAPLNSAPRLCSYIGSWLGRQGQEAALPPCLVAAPTSSDLGARSPCEGRRRCDPCNLTAAAGQACSSGGGARTPERQPAHRGFRCAQTDHRDARSKLCMPCGFGGPCAPAAAGGDPRSSPACALLSCPCPLPLARPPTVRPRSPPPGTDLRTS